MGKSKAEMRNLSPFGKNSPEYPGRAGNTVGREGGGAAMTGCTAMDGVVFLTAAGALSQLLAFCYRVAMSRMVGAEVMGLYQLLMSAYAVLQSVTLTGLTAAVSNLTPRYLARNNSRGADRILSWALRLFFLLMLPACAFVLLCSDGISVYLLGDARTRLGLVLLLPCAALTGIENLHKHAFYGAGQVRIPGAVDLAEQCIRAGAVLGLLWLFLPQYPERAAGLIVLGMWACEVFSALTLTALSRCRRRRVGLSGPGERGRTCCRQIGAVALPVGLNALLGNLLGAANAALVPQKLVQGGLDRTQALSEFGVVCGMTMPMLAVPTVFLGAVSLTLMPQLVRASSMGRQGEAERLISRAVGTVGALTLPAMGLMAAVGEDLGRFLFRQEGVGEYLLPLAGVMAACCYESVFSSVLSALGRQRAVAVIAGLCGGVQLAVTMGTVAHLGMAGYVLGAAVSAALGVTLSLGYTLRCTGMRPDWFHWLWAPGLAAALGAMNGALLSRALKNAGMGPPVAALTALAFGLGTVLAALQALGLGPAAPEIEVNALYHRWEEKRMKGKKLALCLAVPLGVGGLSWLLTREGMAYFQAETVHPPLTPPQWLFPVVWTALFLLMGLASYLVWKSQKVGQTTGGALELYALQLGFSLVWTVLFFTGRRYALAFFWLVAYWLLILWTALKFFRCRRGAGWMMVPYLLWVAFAGYLNFAVWQLN